MYCYYCPAAKHEGRCALDQTYNECISEWWDILINKNKNYPARRISRKLIVSVPSLSICEVLCMRSFAEFSDVSMWLRNFCKTLENGMRLQRLLRKWNVIKSEQENSFIHKSTVTPSLCLYLDSCKLF